MQKGVRHCEKIVNYLLFTVFSRCLTPFIRFFEPNMFMMNDRWVALGNIRFCHFMILWKQVEIDDHNNKIGKGEIFYEKTDEKRTFGKERKTMDRRSYEPVPFRNNDAGYGKGIVKRVFFDGKG